MITLLGLMLKKLVNDYCKNAYFFCGMPEKTYSAFDK